MNTSALQAELLTDRKVEKLLNVSRAALRRWRTSGEGPPWVRIGKRLVRYPSDKLREWIEQQAGVGTEARQ